MVVDVNLKVASESFNGFAGAPCSSKEPVHVCSNHGAAMVEAEDGIKDYFLEFSLPRHAAALAFDGLVRSFGKVSFDQGFVQSF